MAGFFTNVDTEELDNACEVMFGHTDWEFVDSKIFAQNKSRATVPEGEAGPGAGAREPTECREVVRDVRGETAAETRRRSASPRPKSRGKCGCAAAA